MFPVNETSLYQNESESGDNILITSSSDHFIRLWWKGRCRCFKVHTGPVSTLSDKFLGNDTGKIFASGGEDCTVRLWSINSTGKCGQNALMATLYGHEKDVSLMSVAGYKTYLLVSFSKNGKVRVWDTTAASSSRATCCVGMTSVPDAPIYIHSKPYPQSPYFALVELEDDGSEPAVPSPQSVNSMFKTVVGGRRRGGCTGVGRWSAPYIQMR